MKDTNGIFDNYSISNKRKQIFIALGYELTEKDFFYELNKLTYKNEYLSIQQKRNITKSKTKLF